MQVACDWDGTIVDPKTQEWLPARENDVAPLDALKRLLRDGHRVIINTCRANWPEGHASVEAKLQAAGFDVDRRLSVWTGAGKPHADVYADNLSFPPFEGQWRALLAHVARATPVPRPRVSRYSAPTVQIPKGWTYLPRLDHGWPADV